MIIKSFFAFYYFLFLIGASIYLTLNNFKNVEKLFLSSIIYSLSFSWFFIYFINIFNLNFSFATLMCFFGFSLAIIFFNNRNKIEINSNEINYFLIYFLLIFLIFFSILLSKYIPVFVHGDAVFQWNGRWAWSLYLNNFKPDGTYPVFWPGLWALIYKSESVLIIGYPSLSQFILPILLIITLYFSLEVKNYYFIINFSYKLFWIFKEQLWLIYGHIYCNFIFNFFIYLLFTF